jgi:hypothetical protein
MPKINLSIEELRSLQNALLLVDAVKRIMKLFEMDIPSVGEKVDAIIGSKDYMLKRQNAESAIKEFFGHDQVEMDREMKDLYTKMPLPEALRH